MSFLKATRIYSDQEVYAKICSAMGGQEVGANEPSTDSISYFGYVVLAAVTAIFTIVFILIYISN
jgi:hypothetical protein